MYISYYEFDFGLVAGIVNTMKGLKNRNTNYCSKQQNIEMRG